MRAAVLFLALVAACGPEQASIGKLELAIGVPENGFPSWEERVIHVLTNRARADPAAESDAICGGACTKYPVSLPLDYLAAAGRAARFQSVSLIKAKSGLMHDSVCELVSNLGSIYPDTCDGSPSCACVGGAASCACSGSAPYCTAPGGLTAWNVRVSRFGVSAAGENIAAGYSDPISAFSGWVKSSGHWSNLNKSSHRRIGTGFASGTGGCWSATYAQVFTGGTAVTGLVGGAHHPKTGSATTGFKLWANYSSGGAPELATVNIDGTCHPMSLERGSTSNGTYLLQQTLAAGCHRYYFYFRDENGTVTSYPSAGSYGVGVASSGCADYSTDRPSAGTGCGGCTTAADCDDKNPCTVDSCVAGKCQSAPVASCCTTAAECDDKSPCTQDSCVANTCKSAAVAGCCTTAAQCDDKNPCTQDSCVANKCQASPVAGCCTTAAGCDDKNPCTQDSCVANKCQAAPVTGCCLKDVDCDDKSACTEDRCVANKCQSTALPGCCTKESDCLDNNPCTVETCEVATGTCSSKTTAGCCASDADCLDSDPCTLDSCDAASHACKHTRQPGCGPDGALPPSSGDGGAAPGSDAGLAPDLGPPSNVGFPPESEEPRKPRLEGGCGCSVASAPEEGLGLLLLLGLGLALRTCLSRAKKTLPGPATRPCG